jgi:peptidoglycan/xylan/chitin deacetylase (PgdA/CDA1 family)
MIRSGVKWGASLVLRRSGAHRVLARLAGPRLPALVLGYHRVVPDFDAAARHVIPAMLVSVRMLERHIDWIARTHQFVTIDEAARALLPGAPRPGRPLAAITFDDGYADVHDHALPLLSRKGIPAAAFIPTDLVGTAEGLAHDTLHALLRRALAGERPPREALRMISRRSGCPQAGVARALLAGDPIAATRAALCSMPLSAIGRLLRALEEELGPADLGPDPPRPLTWDMVAALREAGWTIGSHTRSHPFLTAETPARVAEEVAGSAARLSRHAGEPVRHFAYPDGRFDRAIVEAVAQAGYAHAWTVCAHRDPSRPGLTLPRRLLWERSALNPAGGFSGDVLACGTAGTFDLFARCGMNHADGTPSPRRAEVA